MEDAVERYVVAIPPATRPLFDRFHGLVTASFPHVGVVISYKMPTYVVRQQRLYVGAWKHGLSMYGWEAGRDAGFVERHPELSSGKGTIRLTHAAAAGIPDGELVAFIHAALDAAP